MLNTAIPIICSKARYLLFPTSIAYHSLGTANSFFIFNVTVLSRFLTLFRQDKGTHNKVTASSVNNETNIKKRTVNNLFKQKIYSLFCLHCFS